MPLDTGHEDLASWPGISTAGKGSFYCESQRANLKEDRSHLHERLSFLGAICTLAWTLYQRSSSVRLIPRCLVLASHNTSELWFRTKDLISYFFLSREYIVGDRFMLENTQSITSWMKMQTDKSPIAMTLQSLPCILSQGSLSHFHGRAETNLGAEHPEPKTWGESRVYLTPLTIHIPPLCPSQNWLHTSEHKVY